jgi:hypothetical protein
MFKEDGSLALFPQHAVYSMHTSQECSQHERRAPISCYRLILWLALIAQPATASIVVFGITPGKIIIAADSRIGEHGQYQDNVCKLAALNQLTGYAAVHITEFPADLLGDGMGWSAMNTARAAPIVSARTRSCHWTGRAIIHCCASTMARIRRRDAA